MKKYEEIFLKLMKKSLLNRLVELDINDFDEWDSVRQLSDIHQVSPMIYDACHTYIQPEQLKLFWKRQMFMQTAMQIQRTIEFSKMYSLLKENDIKSLVFKGIICRNTYPKSDLRISGDEDILIKSSDLLKVDQIFTEKGYVRDKEIVEGIDEVGYRNLKNGSYIEVHTKLFGDDSVYSFLNDEFNDVFETSIDIEIDGVNYSTFETTTHLFYLFTHAYKHFVHGGFGLRQVSDMMMFMHKYGNLIDYIKLNSLLNKYHFESFWFNLLDIAEKYLGYSYELSNYTRSSLKLDSSDLLADLLDSGIFGQSTMERKHSANMTLSALDNSSTTTSIFKSLFPSVSYIKNNYEYVNKCILLLPIGYIHRILNYLKNRKNNHASSSIEIGKKRIELLKKYDLVK